MQRYAARWVLPMDGPPVRDATVVVVEGRVADIQTALPRDVVVADVLTPGLVNAHAHLEYGPGFADLATGGRPFPQWLAAMIARRQALSTGQWEDQARASVVALLATGTTCVADVVTHGPGIGAGGRRRPGRHLLRRIGGHRHRPMAGRARAAGVGAGCRAADAQRRDQSAHALHPRYGRAGGAEPLRPGTRPAAASAPR